MISGRGKGFLFPVPDGKRQGSWSCTVFFGETACKLFLVSDIASPINHPATGHPLFY